MHVDRANQITVATKAAGAACPRSSLGLVLMPAARTTATGSSFGAGEARDAGLLGFEPEVVDVLAILPQGHALMVMPALSGVAHSVRIADEEPSHLVLDAKVDDLAGGLVANTSHLRQKGGKSRQESSHLADHQKAKHQGAFDGQMTRDDD